MDTLQKMSGEVISLNPIISPVDDFVLRMLELGSGTYLSRQQSQRASIILSSLPTGATIKDFLDALDLEVSFDFFCSALRITILSEHKYYERFFESAV